MDNFKIYFLFIALIAFTSCNNNDDNQFQDLKEFYSSNLEPEVYTFKNNQDIKIFGKQGTRVTIPKAAISYIIGDIKISFKEFIKKSDLILNNIPTNSVGDSWLETGGSFFLHIQDSNGKSIFLDKNIILEFPINSSIADTSNMSVWRGDGEALLGNLRPFNIWREISLTNSGSGANVEINSESQEYIMNAPAYNWINCDHIFESTSELSKLKVSILNRSIDIEDVNTFLVLKNINSVLRLNQNDNFFESFPIPIGEEAFIISLGINGDYFLYIEPITISLNQTIQIHLDQIELNELYERIKVLDNLKVPVANIA